MGSRFHILVHHWRKLGQEPQTTGSFQGHEGGLLTGLLLTACSACFLIESRTISTISTISSLMALCTVGSPPAPIAALIKYTAGLPTAISYGEIFSIEVPFSQMTIVYVDIKLASTPTMANLCCTYTHGCEDFHWNTVKPARNHTLWALFPQNHQLSVVPQPWNVDQLAFMVSRVYEYNGPVLSRRHCFAPYTPPHLLFLCSLLCLQRW